MTIWSTPNFLRNIILSKAVRLKVFAGRQGLDLARVRQRCNLARDICTCERFVYPID